MKVNLSDEGQHTCSSAWRAAQAAPPSQAHNLQHNMQLDRQCVGVVYEALPFCILGFLSCTLYGLFSFSICSPFLLSLLIGQQALLVLTILFLS